MDCVVRFLVTKHSWRGKYRRVMAITTKGVVTLDPTTFAETNTYYFDADIDSVSVGGVVKGEDKSDELEFILSCRSEGKGKHKPIKFSTRDRSALLTSLLRCRSAATIPVSGASQSADTLTFNALKLLTHVRGSSGQLSCASVVLRVTPVGLEQLDPDTAEVAWHLDFQHFGVPGLEVLKDNRDHGFSGYFAVHPSTAELPCVFSSAQRSKIIDMMIMQAASGVGVTVKVDSSAKVEPDQLLQSVAETDKATTPVGEWSLLRVTLAVAKFGQSPPYWEEVWQDAPTEEAEEDNGTRPPPARRTPRRLVLTAGTLVERDEDSYAVTGTWQLTALKSVVRYLGHPQQITLVFGGGSMVVYSSPERDQLLAAILDTAQQAQIRQLPVLSSPPLLSSMLGGGSTEQEVEGLQCKMLMTAGREVGAMMAGTGSRAEQEERLRAESADTKYGAAISTARQALRSSVGVPSKKSETALRIRLREFNACVPYAGLSAPVTVPEVLLPDCWLSHNACCSELSLGCCPSPRGAPGHPRRTPAEATEYLAVLQALHRLISGNHTTITAVTVSTSPPSAYVRRIFGLLESGNDLLISEASRLLAIMCGLSFIRKHEAKSEVTFNQSAAVGKAKAAIFYSSLQCVQLLTCIRGLPRASPLATMSVVEVLEAVLCEPGIYSTDDTTYVGLLAAVAQLGRPLFALFAHPAPNVRDITAMLMRSVAEGGKQAAAPMRDAALREGALLPHLQIALFDPPGDRRELSRNLIALWVDSYAPSLQLLKRTLPPGLVAHLLSEKDGNDGAGKRKVSGGDKGVTRTRGGVRLVGNWDALWAAATEDSCHAGLVWDHETRSELQAALADEERLLRLEQERRATEERESQRSGAEEGEQAEGSEGEAQEVKELPRLSWNYAEFRVKYNASKELCVGGYYVRLLLEGDSDLEVEKIAEPKMLFYALHQRFLTAADADLLLQHADATTDAVYSSASSGPEVLDVEGLGVGGGAETRELCVRAMRVLYAGRGVEIGRFNGLAHMVALLDRTRDRPLRHGLLELLDALLLVADNAHAMVEAGGVEVLVQLLASAHEANEREPAPLGPNMIAATAHVEAPKEWYTYRDGAAGGGRGGPRGAILQG
ncbi:hypothetical protein CYMTET_37788 [Cymbomonas tetramitiformis]|uniref:DnaJ homologue subfamily C GRV2/DNAJC13 N-terminal domain-containing protein n=1 Tax=Cymbomonas tetramitiformis TaxID=36881 RepID=A0AAE0CER0_9CHLO|nr:hypothetical protein CYMTET_37788 [Cymbomonas tetramitiformis]